MGLTSTSEPGEDSCNFKRNEPAGAMRKGSWGEPSVHICGWDAEGACFPAKHCRQRPGSMLSCKEYLCRWSLLGGPEITCSFTCCIIHCPKAIKQQLHSHEPGMYLAGIARSQHLPPELSTLRCTPAPTPHVLT